MNFSTVSLLTHVLQNKDYQGGGQGDWGNGVGLLYIYIDDLEQPVLTTYLDISTIIQLDNDGAYVGFTAATGDSHWQTHDIASWQFRSLYIDKKYTSPTIVNGVGAYECMNIDECVHLEDTQHFIRMDKYT